MELLALEVEHNDWSVVLNVFVEVDDLVRVVLDSLDKIGVGVLLPFRFRHRHLLDLGFIASLSNTLDSTSPLFLTSHASEEGRSLPSLGLSRTHRQLWNQ